ncbi:hypothetical protein ACFQ78_27145 [Streptomyces sp. NPDC056519]|uniref:hypothetical protein n=1 Tax=Streptomyces sp. NPDC056519 TaxID=3345849 RepID=UPI0036A8A94B
MSVTTLRFGAARLNLVPGRSEVLGPAMLAGAEWMHPCPLTASSVAAVLARLVLDTQRPSPRA